MTAWPLAASGQQRMRVIGVVSISNRDSTLKTMWYQAFLQRMGELGWTPGVNISIEYRFADNDPALLPGLANDLVGLNVDAIYVPTRPALPVVRAATATIPIVFVSLGDPVAEGWVSNLGRPGGNLTGVAGLSPDLAGKRLELLREFAPSLRKVANLRNSTNRTEEVAVRATETAAQKLGIAVIVEAVPGPVS